MKAFFHPAQDLHIPKTYFTRGQMRQPQEVPDRTGQMLEGLKAMAIPVLQPADQGAAPISKVHDLGYLRFLESAHRRWMEMEDWGDEVMSNIFVRSPNAMRGILAEAACYLADGSCPIGENTWKAAYWSAQTALGAADALMAGERNAYAVCRPPGHHARKDAAGGFCYLNNAAIAAEHLKSRFPRTVILDTDMHHGQGIQDIFYTAMYCISQYTATRQISIRSSVALKTSGAKVMAMVTISTCQCPTAAAKTISSPGLRKHWQPFACTSRTR